MTRSDFIQKFIKYFVTGASIFGVYSLARQLFSGLAQDDSEIDIGPAEGFREDIPSLLPDLKIFIVRKQNIFKAVSAKCTHLGCIVEPEGTGFICPCHGSSYNKEGEVTSGAARQNLKWFKLTVTGDNNSLVLNKNVEVPPESSLDIEI